MKLHALRAATLFFALAACAPITTTEYSDRSASAIADLPPMLTFGAPRVQRSVRTNSQLAQDFLELTFELESGRQMPRFTRYEGEILIELRGNSSPTLERDLNRLVSRLQSEANLPVRRASPGESADIVVEVLTRRDLQRVVPQAACFVVPRVNGWQEFRKARRSAAVDWTTLHSRQMASVFLPGDVSPQEARDCLHEEIAQALGPLNDLYRLPDSVFNDDNFHAVLTGFDMLMLRATYDKSLSNGMSRQQVAAALPGVLARLNPGGQRGGPTSTSPTPRTWVDAIEKALGPRSSTARRQAAARRAVDLAYAAGWRDTRLGFSLYALGRLSLNDDPQAALGAFVDAAQIYRALPDTQIQAAHVSMQLAAYALSAGQADATIRLIDESLPAVRDAENAALLSSLLMMRAEALAMLGQASAANAMRREALGWARYGFGSDQIVVDRAVEIAALAPVPRDR